MTGSETVKSRTEHRRRPQWEFGGAIVGIILMLPGSVDNGAPYSSDSYVNTPIPSVVNTSPIILPSPETATAQATPSAQKRECQAGTPISIQWPDVGIQAPIQTVGVDIDGNLAAPSNKHMAGWYADGPKPGGGEGNVLIDAHRYTDGSAVVPPDFEQRLGAVGVGSVLTLVMDNGSLCKYKITWQTTVDKSDTNVGYSALVNNRNLYRQDGPEGIGVITCAGAWNAARGTSQKSSVAEGVPIN